MRYVIMAVVVLLCMRLGVQRSYAKNIAIDSTKTHVKKSAGVLAQMIIYKGEKMEYARLPEVLIVKKVSKKVYRAYKNWNRVRRAVYTCYPYLQFLLRTMKETEDSLAHFTSARERRVFLREREKMLKENFAARIRNMTLFEGKVLLKLFHRETNKTGYAIVREFRGKFTAAFYQGIARVFGGSLKYTYDPINNEEDRKIEACYWEVRKVYDF